MVPTDRDTLERGPSIGSIEASFFNVLRTCPFADRFLLESFPTRFCNREIKRLNVHQAVRSSSGVGSGCEGEGGDTVSGGGRDAINNCAEDMLRVRDVGWDVGGEGEEVGAGVGSGGENDCYA